MKRTNSHSRCGLRDQASITGIERLQQGQAQQASREAVLEHARFRTPKHRRIYAALVAGLSYRQIGRRFRIDRKNVMQLIHTYDRQHQKDAAQRLTIDANTAKAWARYTWGREHHTDKPAIESVLCQLRSLPQEPPSPELLYNTSTEFRLRWMAAGLTHNSTHDEVLEAAKTWSELTTLLQRIFPQ